MSTPNPRPSRSRTLWGAGVAVAACAVCCAGPLLAVLGGIGAASALAAIWVPALGVLALLAVVAVVVGRRRRRRASACGSDAGPVALGLPTLGDPQVLATRPDR